MFRRLFVAFYIVLFFSYNPLSAHSTATLRRIIGNPRLLTQSLKCLKDPKKRSQICQLYAIDFNQYNEVQLDRAVRALNWDVESKMGLLQTDKMTKKIVVHEEYKRLFRPYVIEHLLNIKPAALSLWFMGQGFDKKKINACDYNDLLKMRIFYIACQQRQWMENILLGC